MTFLSPCIVPPGIQDLAHIILAEWGDLGRLQSTLTAAFSEGLLQNTLGHLPTFSALRRDAKMLLNIADSVCARENGIANFAIGDLITDTNVHVD